MTSTCDRCGTTAPTGAAFCPTCGSPLDGGAGPGAGATTGGGEQPGEDVGSQPWGGPPRQPPPGGWDVPPPPADEHELGSDARNLGLLAHLSAFVTLAGVPSFVGPLVVWQWKRQDDAFVAEHAREALNFNLSVLLYAVVGGLIATFAVIATLGIGMLLVVPIAIVLGIAWFVLVIVGGMAASRGEGYRYPVTIRFVR